MQVITETSSNLAKYIFDDVDSVQLKTSHINTPNFRICDLNSSLATLSSGVTTVPEDFKGNHYTYDGSTWVKTSQHPDNTS